MSETIGPQKQPATVGQIEAQTKQARRELGERAGRYLAGPSPEAERDTFDNCRCRTCDPNPKWGDAPKIVRMHLCEFCANKRCPHAEWHGYQCTGSNESGQVPTLVRPADQPAGAEASVEQYRGCWPPQDLVAKLIEAAEILLDDHSYDGDGNEQIRMAVRFAKTTNWHPAPATDELAELRAENERLTKNLTETNILLIRQTVASDTFSSAVLKQVDGLKKAVDEASVRCADQIATLTAKLAEAERERDALREAARLANIEMRNLEIALAKTNSQPPTAAPRQE